eukprot:674839-Pleurochrysis_carterae.AAC.2
MCARESGRAGLRESGRAGSWAYAGRVRSHERGDSRRAAGLERLAGADLLLGAVDGERLVKLGVWPEERRRLPLLCIALAARRLAVAQRPLADGWARAAENGNLAADVLRDLVGRLERRAERNLGRLRVGEHGRQALKGGGDRLLVLAQVDEQVVRLRQEDLVRLCDDVHRGRAAVERVEVQRRIKGDEAYLGALAARQPVERVLDRGGHAAQHAARDGRVAHLDDEEEDGRLRRSHHVL